MDKIYDYIVVGSGLWGSVFAQQAHENGRSVLVIEKRKHLGGNCYSYDFEDTGINVHKYGTHVFHTSNKFVWNYINRFTEFNSYQHKVLTQYKNKMYSMPINLGTINNFYNINLKPFEVSNFFEGKIEDITNPNNLEEKAISLIGRELYNAFIKGYTKKQWGCSPKELPSDIITRLPIRYSYNDLYFNDLYQGIPINGYAPMFNKLLEGIHIKLEVDFFCDRGYWEKACSCIVYTGPIDRFYNYKFGRLGWRSVDFEYTTYDIDDYQGNSVINYADEDIPYSRIHEPKHLHPERRFPDGRTVIVKEYPCKGSSESPFYPINSNDNKKCYKRYHDLASSEKRVIFGGRLAEYKYYDMDQVIDSALKCAEKCMM